MHTVTTVQHGGHELGYDEQSGVTSNYTSKHPRCLQEAIKALVEAAVHRIYVCDKSDQPTGIITLTDILKLVVS